ncbi:uncharacterized protein DNG_03740 [Cephalotrichum gorgonifer]|uniref:Rhodopsin domain-containing protein n=1 Tax=Cephalotrichum gorgonifer TaxID=2041049 RepID=A0AAE8MVU9_9PEZI|nr:uncharacterized protein DNG_03740 [Cephalotrichum gorgonifer]
MPQTDQERQNGLVITTIVLTSLSFIFVLARSVVRIGLMRKGGWDDYLMILAMICSAGYLAEVMVLRENKGGFSSAVLSLENMINLLKITLAIQLTYYVAIAAIKLSILAMYLRFLASQTTRLICKGTMALHVAFFIVCFITTIAQCRPMHKFWAIPPNSVEGYCINTTVFFYFTSGFNIVTDIFIIALPIPTLRKINRPQREKYALLAIFLLGTFATVMAITRLHSIYTYTLATDPFQQAILVNLWSVIEVNSAILTACAPALKPLFTPHLIRASREGSYAQKPMHYGSNNTSGSRGYIRSKKSVEQSWAPGSITMNSLYPANTHTEVTGGPGSRDGPYSSKDTSSTVGILPMRGA